MSGPAIAGVEGRLGFTITVPDSWYEVDTAPATREDNIRRMVEDRCRGNDEMWAQRHGIRKVLEQNAASAHAAGAVYCAGFATPTDDGPITGSVTVSLVHDPRTADTDTDWLSQSFRTVARKADPEAPYSEVGVVQVPGIGPSPRTSGIEDGAVGEGHYVRNVSMLTAVQVRDLDRVFLIACSSPVVALADALLDLFDAVTGTFRVVRLDADDETADAADAAELPDLDDPDA